MANTTQPTSPTKADLLRSMEYEATFDSIIESATIPSEIYDAIKIAQHKWQLWLDAQISNMTLDEEELRQARKWRR
jgi:hypothetical protein